MSSQFIHPAKRESALEDKRKRVELLPEKIIWKQGEVKREEVLLLPHSSQISLVPQNGFEMKNNGRQASILLDFGSEIHGGIKLLIWDAETPGSTEKAVQLRIRFGESATEAMSEIGDGNHATNDHAIRDIKTQAGMMSMSTLGETGFRFVRIDLLNPGAGIIIKSITAVMVYKDVEWKGSFRCNDALLNQIWDVGAYTVHLNMMEYVWDGIKRDRLVWVGDMHPETMTIWTVFGEDDSVERSLDFIRKETPLPGWMNQMASYTMWYAIIVYDWYLHTGTRSFLEKQREYLIGIKNQLHNHIDENGKDSVTEGRFLDWPSSDRPGVVDAGVQAIHSMALERLEKIFLVLKEQEAAEQCKADRLRLRCFSADYENSKQAAALLVLAGLKDAWEVNESLLKKDGAKGMSTFMGYYILAARALAGDIKGCLSSIREYWGGMLKLGATTFWEDFDVSWLENAAPIDRLPLPGEVDVHGTYGDYCYQGYRHSLCHGWASGVTPWLSEHILGIQVVEPGCKKISIRQELGDLDWAKGTFPTPYGAVEVSHKKQENGSIKTVVTAPIEVEIITAFSCVGMTEADRRIYES